MHHEALYKAFKYLKGRRNLAERLGVHPDTLTKSLNRNKSLDFVKAVRIDQLTDGHVSIEDLVPHFSWVISYIQQRKNRLIKQDINAIKVDFALPESLDGLEILSRTIQNTGTQHSITVSADGYLLYGYSRLLVCKSEGLKTISVNVIPIEIHDLSLLKPDMFSTALLSERILAVYSLLQRHRELPKSSQTEICTQIISSCPTLDGSSFRIDEWLSQQLGLGSKSHYYKLLKIVQAGCQILIHQLNTKQISANLAYMITQYPHDIQKKFCCLAKSQRKNFLSQLREKAEV